MFQKRNHITHNNVASVASRIFLDYWLKIIEKWTENQTLNAIPQRRKFASAASKKFLRFFKKYPRFLTLRNYYLKIPGKFVKFQAFSRFSRHTFNSRHFPGFPGFPGLYTPWANLLVGTEFEHFYMLQYGSVDTYKKIQPSNSIRNKMAADYILINRKIQIYRDYRDMHHRYK